MADPDHPPEPIAAVVITDELLRRRPAKPDYLREKRAMQDLAQQMADRPTEIIPRLVALAMEICDGVSAGVSVLDRDTNRFRWLGVQGALAAMQGVTVPVERPATVRLEGRDEVGAEVAYDLEGMPARIAQHEFDHLDGVLILDRTTSEGRREALAVLRQAAAL